MFSFLTDQQITEKELKLLKYQDIIRFVPNVGLQVKLLGCLQNIATQTNDSNPTSNPTSTQTLSNVRLHSMVQNDSENEAPVSKKNKTDDSILQWNEPYLKNFNLENFLKSSLNGGIILSHGKTAFPDKIKIMLTRILIDHFVEKRIKLGRGEFEIIAKKINHLFQNEDVDEYYLPTEGSKPRGRLAERFYNVMKDLRKHGVISKVNRIDESNNGIYEIFVSK